MHYHLGLRVQFNFIIQNKTRLKNLQLYQSVFSSVGMFVIF